MLDTKWRATFQICIIVGGAICALAVTERHRNRPWIAAPTIEFTDATRSNLALVFRNVGAAPASHYTGNVALLDDSANWKADARRLCNEKIGDSLATGEIAGSLAVGDTDRLRLAIPAGFTDADGVMFVVGCLVYNGQGTAKLHRLEFAAPIETTGGPRIKDVRANL